MVRSSASARSTRNSTSKQQSAEPPGVGDTRNDDHDSNDVAAAAEGAETGNSTTTNSNNNGTGSDTASASSSSAPSSSVNNDTNDDDDEKDLFFYERWNREITGIREKLDEKLQTFVESSQHEMDVLSAAVTGIVSKNSMNETAASKPLRVGVGPKTPTKKAVAVDVDDDEFTSTFDIPVSPSYRRFSQRKISSSSSPAAAAARSPQSRASALLAATASAGSPPPIHTVMSKASSKASKASDKTELANNLSRRRARRLRRLRQKKEVLKAVNEEAEDKKGTNGKNSASAISNKSANSNNPGGKEEISGNATVLSNASAKEENAIEVALNKNEAIKPNASMSSATTDEEIGPKPPPPTMSQNVSNANFQQREHPIPEKATPPPTTTTSTTQQNDRPEISRRAFNEANSQTNTSKPPVTMPRSKRSIRRTSSDQSRKSNQNSSSTTDDDSDAISLARSEHDRRDKMLEEERQRQASMLSRRRRQYFFPSSSSLSSSEKKKQKHSSTTSDSEASTNMEEEGSTMTTNTTSRTDSKHSAATGKPDETSSFGSQQKIGIKHSFASGQTPLSPVAETSIESPRDFWVQKEREALQQRCDQSSIEVRRASKSVTRAKDSYSIQPPSSSKTHSSSDQSEDAVKVAEASSKAGPPQQQSKERTEKTESQHGSVSSEERKVQRVRSDGSNSKTAEAEESRKLTVNTQVWDEQPAMESKTQRESKPKELTRASLHSVTKRNEEEPTSGLQAQKAQQTLSAAVESKPAPGEHQPLKLKAQEAFQRGETGSTTSRKLSRSYQPARLRDKSNISVENDGQEVIDVRALEMKEQQDRTDAHFVSRRDRWVDAKQASTVPRDHRGTERSVQREIESTSTVGRDYQPVERKVQRNQDGAFAVRRDQEPVPPVRRDQTAELNAQRDQTAELNAQRDQTVELRSDERTTTHSNSQTYTFGYHSSRYGQSIDSKQRFSGNDIASGSRATEEPPRRTFATRTPVEPPPSSTYSQAREFFMLKDKKNDAPTEEDLADDLAKRADPPEVRRPFLSSASARMLGIRTSFSTTSPSVPKVDSYSEEGTRSATSQKQSSRSSRTGTRPGDYLSILTTNSASEPCLQETTDPDIVPAASSLASPMAASSLASPMSASSMGACSTRAVGPAPSSVCLSPTSTTRAVLLSSDQSEAEESVACSTFSATMDDNEVTPVHTNVGKHSSDSSSSRHSSRHANSLPSVEHLAESSAKLAATTSSVTTNLNIFSEIDEIGNSDDDHDWNEDNMNENDHHPPPSETSAATPNEQASEASSIERKRKVAEACKQRLQLDISGVHESEMSQSKDAESRTVSTLTSSHFYSRRGQEKSVQQAKKAPTSPREELPYYVGDGNEEKKEETTADNEEPVVPRMEHVKNRKIVDPYGDAGMYTGVLIRGKPDSYGIMEYEDGRVYTGSWKRGRWDGHGKTIFTNGDCYTGEYYDDQRQGIGRYEWADGRIYDGRFEADQREGTGIYSWPDGSVYNGEFHKGLRHGNGTYAFADGSVYNGGWKKGKQHGIGECVWKDGRCYRGEWESGQAHGYGIEVRGDGTIRYDGIWKHDRPVRQKTKNRVEQQVKRSATLRQVNAAVGKTALGGKVVASSSPPLSKATPIRTSSGSVSADDDDEVGFYQQQQQQRSTKPGKTTKAGSSARKHRKKLSP